MTNKRVKKQFWLSEEQAAYLAKVAKITKLNEVTIIRMLLDGYHPKEAPGIAFYYDTNRMINAAEHLAEAAKSSRDPEVREALLKECQGLKDLRLELLKRYVYLDKDRSG